MKDILFERNAFKEDLQKYATDNSIYFHFSTLNRVGVNPKYSYSTPIGVYGYSAIDIYPKIHSGKDYFGHNREYCHVLRNVSDNMLVLQEFAFNQLNRQKFNEIFDKYNHTDNSLDEVLLHLKRNPNSEYPIRSQGDLFWSVLYFLCEYDTNKLKTGVKKSAIMMNSILRQLGYDSVLDTAGTVHKMQTTQVIFLEKSSYEHIDTVRRFDI